MLAGRGSGYGPRLRLVTRVVTSGLNHVVPTILVLEEFIVAKPKQNQIAKRMIGRHIVADPAICHGEPTFRGTRILVADVMEQVAGGIDWETIREEWRGDISVEAISEAVRLASQAFLDHSSQYTIPEYVLERAPA